MNITLPKPALLEEPWAVFQSRVLDSTQLKRYGLEGYEREPARYPHLMFVIQPSLERHISRWEEEGRLREVSRATNELVIYPRFYVGEYYYCSKVFLQRCGITEEGIRPRHYAHLYFHFFPLENRRYVHFTCYDSESGFAKCDCVKSVHSAYRRVGAEG